MNASGDSPAGLAALDHLNSPPRYPKRSPTDPSVKTLVDESIVAQRNGILHNLELMTWMPVHAALLYATVRLISDDPKDSLSVVITVVVASLIASSMASIAIKRVASRPDDNRPCGLPARASERILTMLPFCFFFHLACAHDDSSLAPLTGMSESGSKTTAVDS